MTERENEQGIQAEQPTAADTRITAEEPLQEASGAPPNWKHQKPATLWHWMPWVPTFGVLGIIIAHALIVVEASHYTEQGRYQSHSVGIGIRPLQILVWDIRCASGMTLMPGHRDTS